MMATRVLIEFKQIKKKKKKRTNRNIGQQQRNYLKNCSQPCELAMALPFV